MSPRLRVLLGLSIAAFSLWLVSCGDSDDGDNAGTTSSETSVTSASSETTEPIPPSSETSETSPSSGTSATPAVARPTVVELEQLLKAEIEAQNPEVGPGVVDCEASGELSDWQPVLCFFLPDGPHESGAIHVSMFDGGRWAWAPGECCDGAPWPDDYSRGLFCRDLVEPPPGEEGRWLPGSDSLTYGLAVFYWLTENRPDRMDADLDGRPCETVYPADEVTAFWDSARTLQR